MRFEGNSRGITRSDYEQFSQFLGLSQPRYQRDVRINNSTQGNITQNRENHTQGPSLAMVYGVKQEYRNIYDPEIGLNNGTIFEELNLPFYPVGCSMKNREGCL